MCFVFCATERSARIHLPGLIYKYNCVVLHSFSLLTFVLLLGVTQTINDYFDLPCDVINDTSKVNAFDRPRQSVQCLRLPFYRLGMMHGFMPRCASTLALQSLYSLSAAFHANMTS